MPLNTTQKKEIRNIKYGWFYSIDSHGAPLHETSSEKTQNHDLGALRQIVLKNITDRGYRIYNVKPQSANCIIRVYRDEKLYEGTKYRFLGAHCFTKGQDSKWHSVGANGDEFMLDFTKHEIRVWFYQDEYWDASVDFFDTFVKIVKED